MSTGNVIAFPFGIAGVNVGIGRVDNMRACISVQRYDKVDLAVNATWIQLVNRLLTAQQRVDPSDPQGKRLKYWRQGDLAKAAGVRPNTLSEIMNGKSEPSLATLAAIAGALEVPVFYMLMTAEQARTYEAGNESARAGASAAQIRDGILSAIMPRVEVAVEQAIKAMSDAPADVTPAETHSVGKKKRTA